MHCVEDSYSLSSGFDTVWFIGYYKNDGGRTVIVREINRHEL
jgi:hypothetical protein